MNQRTSVFPSDLFRLPLVQGGGLKGMLLRQATPWVEKWIGLEEMRLRYGQLTGEGDFFGQVLDHLGVELELSPQDLEKIPLTGPLVILANHPFGALEGMALQQILRRRREDVKLLANKFLGLVPDTAQSCFFVNPYGGKEASRENLASLKASMAWVKEGGALGIFPSGEVAQMDLLRGELAEAPWQANLARLIRKTGARVLLVHFQGQNSLLFQWAGHLNSKLKTALLPRELLNKFNLSLKARIGTVIEPSKLARYEEDGALMDYLRQRCLLLGHLETGKGKVGAGPRSEVPLAPPQSPEDLAAEVAALPPGAKLTEKAPLEVYLAEASAIPKLLAEIGRLREASFRQAKEGTGKARDLDLFDEYYQHLFLWDTEAKQIAGAYRLGPAEEIFRRFRKKGFYLHSLFKLQTPFLQQVRPGLELGRSFVAPEYQKSFAPLMMLWKGIGAYVAKYPQTRYLFGPVSISADYRPLSRSLMIQYLKTRCFDEPLSRWVKPRHPAKMGLGTEEKALLSKVGDLDELGELVLELEAGRLSVPILLKQYLKLGGKILGFNLDPDFSDVADALLVVDLCHTPDKVLEKYMGKEEALGFRAYWQAQAQASEQEALRDSPFGFLSC
ncbi:MAG: hypothetical protein A2600_00890 [Candidatus Lambdaproteobacteria bacterium RIFOXYD1_FULL_56_27]|uniref:L-ornithine N(alpha)-acyltransferase n=1 Tax=Candidatus Lambdaproteobacteria bacterium RIFOXYD2_FULL_56_26 TaxID=1817773 RepID=A0A1F6GQD5_9PROT|nr:MAG: hypothetical protein A2557_09630 [Candidatus Lambdaproteobacteria bacterium RIFOXYD2_FULL_56_26]OGH01298.1 MAG: hypothetical protein A2426_12840 [Candidatus Lambdaproteobacteria bacterium RIFOXYC1_FULL_56_13]OGH06838.1 MAG: hypothetical protein A2600_00890 [Candidatus Lambdaproteobacteria bacterium RIFOXYD1_FULL_56_27]